MDQSALDEIIAQLTGRRDKHVIAHAYNCRFVGQGDDAFVVDVSARKLGLFRKLGLVTKRPAHKNRLVADADHILTDLGMAVGKAINQQYDLALAQV